jgi:hypothetical protein
VACAYNPKKLRKEDHKFEASGGYIARPRLKNPNQTKTFFE